VSLTSTGAAAEKRAFFSTLGALRGVAATLVMCFHTALFHLGPYFVGVTQFAVRGYLWVDFFFLLSGFVIAHAYGRSFADGIRLGEFGRFARARVLRLYPLHLSMLLLLALAVGLRDVIFGGHPLLPHLLDRPEAFTAQSFGANLVLVQALGLFQTDSWNYPAWSISCEFYAYTLFPLLSIGLARWARPVTALTLALAVATLALLFFRPPYKLDYSYDYAFLRCAAEFSIGVLLYRVFVTDGTPALFARDAFGFGVLGTIVLALHFGVPDIAVVPLFALLILAAAVNDGILRRLFATRPMQWLGEISYSIYLVHFAVLYIMATLIAEWTGDYALDGLSVRVRCVTMLIAVALSLALATLTYRFIEAPGRTLWGMGGWARPKLAPQSSAWAASKGSLDGAR
jgi:peptidoglycan/LPS O-acetylase OafA/YrhL